MSVLQELAPFQVLVGDDCNRLSTLSLVAAEKLSSIAGEITDINCEEKPMAGVDVIFVVTVNVTI
jgi:hypothetical protein